jgi:hypothetical protein
MTTEALPSTSSSITTTSDSSSGSNNSNNSEAEVLLLKRELAEWENDFHSRHGTHPLPHDITPFMSQYSPFIPPYHYMYDIPW